MVVVLALIDLHLPADLNIQRQANILGKLTRCHNKAETDRFVLEHNLKSLFLTNRHSDRLMS